MSCIITHEYIFRKYHIGLTTINEFLLIEGTAVSTWLQCCVVVMPGYPRQAAADARCLCNNKYLTLITTTKSTAYFESGFSPMRYFTFVYSGSEHKHPKNYTLNWSCHIYLSLFSIPALIRRLSLSIWLAFAEDDGEACSIPPTSDHWRLTRRQLIRDVAEKMFIWFLTTNNL